MRSSHGLGSQNLSVATCDGRNEAYSEMSSGVYFCELTAGSFGAAEKMIMMK